MNMENESYGPDARLRDLVDDNNGLLLVLSRFAIPLGFGDASVSAVCADAGVDCNTFLAVANTVSGRPCSTAFSITSLMTYLENSHSYFLDFILPAIREKLIRAINCHDENDVGSLLLRYYDNYVLEAAVSPFSYSQKVGAGTRAFFGFRAKQKAKISSAAPLPQST